MAIRKLWPLRIKKYVESLGSDEFYVAVCNYKLVVIAISIEDHRLLAIYYQDYQTLTEFFPLQLGISSIIPIRSRGSSAF